MRDFHSKVTFIDCIVKNMTAKHLKLASSGVFVQHSHQRWPVKLNKTQNCMLKSANIQLKCHILPFCMYLSSNFAFWINLSLFLHLADTVIGKSMCGTGVSSLANQL